MLVFFRGKQNSEYLFTLFSDVVHPPNEVRIPTTQERTQILTQFQINPNNTCQIGDRGIVFRDFWYYKLQVGQSHISR